MFSWINQLKKQYRQSSIIQFLFSYIAVLSVPLLLSIIGESFAVSVVNTDIKNSNLRILRYAGDLLDENLSAIQLEWSRLANDANLLSIAEQTETTPDYLLDVRKLIDSVVWLNTFNTKQVSLCESLYVSLFSPEYVIADAALYHVDAYLPYIRARGMTEKEWREMCRNEPNNGSRRPFFYASATGRIQYVFPFSTRLSGPCQGAIVCNLSDEELSRLLDFSNEYEAHSMFIFDEKNELMWWKDNLQCASSLFKHQLPQGNWRQWEGIFSFGSYTAIYTGSEKFGWKYLLVLPHRAALRTLYWLRIVLVLLSLCAVFLGLFVSWRLSVHNGRPLNGVFALMRQNNPALESSGQLSPSIQNLVRLFEDMAARSTKKELFYPDLLEDSLILNVKSGNAQEVQAIVSLIQEENETNRSLDDEAFALLHGNMIATLANVCGSEAIPGQLCRVPEKDFRPAFFDSYRAFCQELCSEIWEKKSRSRKILAEKMKEFVDAEYSDTSLGLTRVAATFSVSENYVSVVFKEQVGENFQAYLENVRLGHACDMLKKSAAPVEEIAEKCGYYTVQSFRRAFKRVKGLTPTKYRSE